MRVRVITDGVVGGRCGDSGMLCLVVGEYTHIKYVKL